MTDTEILEDFEKFLPTLKKKVADQEQLIKDAVNNLARFQKDVEETEKTIEDLRKGTQDS